jgi:flagellar hook-associated protein 3 FlgL
MRITNKMMINNSKYWMSKQAEKLSDAEIVSASGKEINKPSDDPSAAAQILEYRSDIAKYEQYQTNIDQASTWIEAGETVYDSLDSLMDQAANIASQESAGRSDYTGTYLESLKGIYDSIIGLANTKCGSDYMYGGTEADSAPFSNEIALSGSADIGFYVASDASDVTLTIYDSSGAELGTYTTTGTEGSNTIAWDGALDDGTSLSDGNYTFTISASDDTSGTAVTVASSCYLGDNGTKSVYISDGNTIELNCDGGEIFTEALSAISGLITALEGYNEGTVDDATATACATQTFESLNNSIVTVKSERVALANIYSQLDVSTDRVDKLSELLQEKLSTLETVNTTEAAVELSAQETAYEVAQSAAAKILNLPKLSDYI